eukprot:GCRY01003489.1.p1 GENE.GCRY01003489.1~~GCRY01003489.1.p1  ORF type:complete len:150 (-),score=5.93 GCRY01003489.1:476-925(-)
MSGHYIFVIVAKDDTPVFQAEYNYSSKGNPSPIYKTQDDKRENNSHLSEFILHSSLDIVDELQWFNSSMNLKVVERFQESYISAFVTASQTRLLLLHDVKNEDGIRNFFQDVAELYYKVVLNPFYKIGEPITSPSFEPLVKNLAKKHLQ